MTKIKCKSLKSRIVMGSKKEGFVRTLVIAMIEMLHDARMAEMRKLRCGVSAPDE